MTTKVDGTNGIVYPDGTTQSTAGALVAPGVGQSWQTFNSSQRSLSTTYTNSSGKPISVLYSTNGTFNGYGVTVVVNGTTIVNTTVYSNAITVFFIVPNGQTYSIGGTGTFGGWSELR